MSKICHVVLNSEHEKKILIEFWSFFDYVILLPL